MIYFSEKALHMLKIIISFFLVLIQLYHSLFKRTTFLKVMQVMQDITMLSLLLMFPQEMRTAAIARPLEINETEKALRAAIKEVLVCLHPDNPHFKTHTRTYFYQGNGTESATMLLFSLIRKVWRRPKTC